MASLPVYLDSRRRKREEEPRGCYPRLRFNLGEGQPAKVVSEQGPRFIGLSTDDGVVALE